MRRNTALLVSLLLVAAALAPAGAGTDRAGSSPESPRVVPVNDTANYASIPANEVRASGFTDVGLDVSTAFAGDTRQLQSDHVILSFERSFERAEAQANRTAAVRKAVATLEHRSGLLERRSRAARRGYANGSLTIDQFTRRRAQIQAAATQLEQTRERITERTDDANGYSLPASLIVRLTNLEGRLAALRGPVGDYVDGAAAGELRPETVYAESSTTGYAMAYVRGGTYVREVYLGSQREPDATDQFAETSESPQSVAFDRTVQLYPWIEGNAIVGPSLYPWVNMGIYRFSVDFPGGELTAYLDGGTTNVFREAQYRQVTSTNVTARTTAESPALVVHVNRTFDTGPMQVTFTQAGTGVPMNGTVFVDGHPVGRTGDDGTLWTVEPRGPFAINATTPAGNHVDTRIPA